MTITQRRKVNIEENIQIGNNVFSMWLKVPDIINQVKAGQFISLFCNNESRLLPRPISICEINKDRAMIRLVYRVVGAGTEEFSQLNKNDSIDIMGPLGNGFTLEGNKAILIGGGIGIPPMLELAKQLTCEKHIVLGYRDSDTFLAEEFKNYGDVYIATEDGSVGTKGNVIDAVRSNNLEADIIYACGPTPMLKGIKDYAKEHGIRTQISMEERMACGVGACLGCVCKSKEKDHHTKINNKRVCKDGPVFYGEEVEL
mgnify:CR=1 FL=1